MELEDTSIKTMLKFDNIFAQINKVVLDTLFF